MAPAGFQDDVVPLWRRLVEAIEAVFKHKLLVRPRLVHAGCGDPGEVFERCNDARGLPPERSDLFYRYLRALVAATLAQPPDDSDGGSNRGGGGAANAAAGGEEGGTASSASSRAARRRAARGLLRAGIFIHSSSLKVHTVHGWCSAAFTQCERMAGGGWCSAACD